MRMLTIAIVIGTSIFTVAGSSNDAKAAVCARGVYRAGVSVAMVRSLFVDRQSEWSAAGTA
jgi:hypothetical protein